MLNYSEKINYLYARPFPPHKIMSDDTIQFIIN